MLLESLYVHLKQADLFASGPAVPGQVGEVDLVRLQRGPSYPQDVCGPQEFSGQ